MKMKVLILITALIAFSSCKTEDKSAESKKRINKSVENAKRTANSFYEDRVGQECDVTMSESNTVLAKIFYTTVVDKRDGSLNLKFYALNSVTPEKITVSGIKIEGKTIGFLYIKLTDEGDEFYSSSDLLRGDKNLTYLELELDNKINEIKANKKITILPTAEAPAMSETVTEWFTITNCEDSTKKAMKGL
jgi:hypothetical protein